MTSFSNNIIFFDTEFTSFDPHKGEILSIGMVKLNGEELYLELEHNPKTYTTEWVKENVLPLLTRHKTPKQEAKKQIYNFVGTANPYLMSYVIEFDGIYLYKLLDVNDINGNKSLPFHWILLDFASVLFTLGKDPTCFDMKKKNNLVVQLGLNCSQYRRCNHALDDAKLLRDAYLKIIN